MTDPLERLEAELAAMHPRSMSAALVDRIGRALDGDASHKSPGRWADRLLIGVMSAGALAACVIATVLLVGSSTTDAKAIPSPMIHPEAALSRADGPPLAFAYANPAWADLMK